MKFKKMRGIIAAGHPLTARAGGEVLRAGGNAVDAAVAASFASFVCETVLTGLWGGGFALVCMARPKRRLVFDFFVDMPGRGLKKIPPKDLDFRAITADFRGATQVFHVGKGSVGVPGNILGLCKLHQTFGCLPLKEVLAPAIAFAKEGFAMTPSQAFVSQILESILTGTAAMRKIYAPAGRLLRAGEMFRPPDLASTLELLAAEGPRIFYQGEVGQKIVRYFKDGGLLTQKDLDSYRVFVREPLLVAYGGEKILMNPSPALGGELIALSLRLLRHKKISAGSCQSIRFLKTMIDVMQETNRLRGETATAIRNRLGNTTQISVMDEAGNAVSLTTSHGAGAGIGIPKLGFPFNNMLGEQDLNPQGFHKMRPGSRFHSMMCPTITLKKGEPHLVLGSGGSNRLRTAIFQTLVKIIDFKMSLKKAVESPRLHWEAGELNVEPGFSAAVTRGLLRLNSHTVFWRQKNLFFGGVHAVLRGARDKFLGVGDSRRGGTVMQVK
ncbi:MAG: gamma-glutamyltransferase [Deltaproteobacteria bacterium]|nr:gamma-glutamyltransferase [Deltaproteobacteria bacterium]